MADAASKSRDVLISGASVAGPALAYWLARHGFRPTVVERAPALRGGGQAVDFRGKAHLSVLERMGILGEVRRLQTSMGAVRIVDEDGRRLSSLPSEIMSGEVEILRGDLCRVFHKLTEGTTEYVFGDSIVSIDEGPDGVGVAFERGATRAFDLVVGADGVHSNVRRLVFGDDPDAIRHLGLYGAVFTADNHLGLERSGVMYSVPGKAASMYSYHDGSVAKASLDFASEPLDYDHRDVENQKQIVAEVFAGVGWEVPRLLGAMRYAPDFYFDSAGQVRIDRYSEGRVVLVGDAGYGRGPGGMGTGLAVVEAYVLAGELAAARGDHRAAFARYERRMRPYVEVCQKQAEGVDRFMVPRTRAQIRLRNLMWRTLPYLPWRGVIGKMTAKAADSITLEDYPVGPPGAETDDEAVVRRAEHRRGRRGFS